MAKYSLAIFLCLLGKLITAQPGFSWAKQIGSSGYDMGWAITVDPLGNVYSTGFFNDTVDFDPGPGADPISSAGMDMYLMKQDPSGNLIWASNLKSDAEEIGSRVFVHNQKVYVTLSHSGVVEFDTAGNFIAWRNPEFEVFDLSIGNKSQLYLTGRFSETADFDPGPGTHNLTCQGVYDAFILKLDSDWNFIWVKQIGGIENDDGFSIILDKNDNIFVSGTFYSTVDFDPGANTHYMTSAGNSDNFILKLDSGGNFKWVNVIGGPSYQYGGKLALDNAGNLYACPTYYSKIILSKLDTSGNFIWTKVLKPNSNFNTDDRANSLAVDANGNLAIVGSFRDTLDFDPDTAKYFLTSAGAIDAFILQLDQDGKFMCAGKMGGPENDEAFSLTISQNNRLYCTGSFANIADMDPGNGIYSLNGTSLGPQIFVEEINSCSETTMAPEELSANIVKLSPNPVSSNLYVLCNNVKKICVYDVFGNCAGTESFDHCKNPTLNFENQPAGIYIVYVTVENGTSFHKIIKE